MDGGAAYANYDTWGETNTNWKRIYYAQGGVGAMTLLSILSAFGGKPDWLLKWSKMHIFAESAILGLVYLAE